MNARFVAEQRRGKRAAGELRLAVLAALSLAAFQSAAQDAKYLMGSTCVPMDGSQWSRVDSYQGSIRNKAGSDTYVTCALLTDKQGVEDVALTLAFRTGSTPGTIACTAYAGDAHFNWTSSRSLAATAPATAYVLEWAPGEIHRSYQSPVGVNCKLPAGVQLETIMLRQQGTP